MQVISLPHVDTARRFSRPRCQRVVAIPIEDRQLTLFAPAILRRRAVRTRKAVAYRSIEGTRTIRWTIERVELDSGLRDRARLHGSDGTFVAGGYVGLDSTRYVNDERCQDFVSRNPDGASLAQVAEALKLGKSTVDDIERRAMLKLLERAKAGDREVRRWFFALAQHVGLDRIAGEYDDLEEDEGMAG